MEWGCGYPELLKNITEKYPVTLTEPYYDLISTNILDRNADMDSAGEVTFDEAVLKLYTRHDLFDIDKLISHAVDIDSPRRVKFYMGMKECTIIPREAHAYSCHVDSSEVRGWLEKEYGIPAQKMVMCVIM